MGGGAGFMHLSKAGGLTARSRCQGRLQTEICGGAPPSRRRRENLSDFDCENACFRLLGHRDTALSRQPHRTHDLLRDLPYWSFHFITQMTHW
jgi:hypothetical protein